MIAAAAVLAGISEMPAGGGPLRVVGTVAHVPTGVTGRLMRHGERDGHAGRELAQ
jgi:hypothetical protein